ncbi:hypothetical protein GCM10011367_28100 [Marinicauda pacifica]|jgi:hypothetical protein|nr:hypothetical protein GCM10011367_28100 [Marinicauda pacifica]
MGMLCVSAVFLVAGCMTSEERAALQAERDAEREEIARMIAAGECQEEHRLGTRTRPRYVCDPSGEGRDASADGAREAVRRIQRQGSICSGTNPACSPD